jgi:hypothetical protein
MTYLTAAAVAQALRRDGYKDAIVADLHGKPVLPGETHSKTVCDPEEFKQVWGADVKAARDIQARARAQMKAQAEILNGLREIHMTPSCFCAYQSVLDYESLKQVFKGVRKLEDVEAKSLVDVLLELKALADGFPYELKPDWTDVRNVRGALATRRVQEKELSEAVSRKQNTAAVSAIEILE